MQIQLFYQVAHLYLLKMVDKCLQNNIKLKPYKYLSLVACYAYAFALRQKYNRYSENVEKTMAKQLVQILFVFIIVVRLCT